MSRGTRSACEVEFPKLLARRDDVDLFDVALEISRDLDPRVDPPACRDWVEARAAELRTDVARAVDETEALRQLASGLCGRHGLAGTSDAYGSIDGSLPHRIIETGRGIPLGLSLVYLAVAGR
ncbi:MAG: transglutaminase family protein, partial [Planctomycetota bacterium]